MTVAANRFWLAGLGLAWALLAGAPALAQEAPRVPVRVFKVGAEQIGGELTGLGSVRCRHSLELGFEATGLLIAVPVEEGQQVKQGQVLARLDDKVLRSETAAKQAEVVSSEAEAQRLSEKKTEREKLYQSRAVTLADLRETGFELDKARAKLESVRAELAALQARLQTMVLKAPLDGVILKRQAEPGEVVSPGGHKLFKIGDCRQVLAEVEFGEKLYSRLKEGQETALTADALPGQQFKGRISSISPEIDDKNRTFVVKVAAENPGFKLKPGMFVRAQVRVEGLGEQAHWIPAQALVSEQGQRGQVTVVEDRRATKREVSLGRREGERVEVLSGLKVGDLVVVPGGPETPGPEPGRP